MNTLRLLPLAAASLAGLVLGSVASAQVRISQVGKGSGLSPNAYNGNFVELYNAGSAPVSLAGKSLQWASTAAGSGWSKVDLRGTIAPGGYWLVRLTATHSIDPDAGFGVPFTADQDRIGFNGTHFSIISATNSGGKVVLADTTALFTTNGCAAPDAALVLDLVAWDDVPSAAACHEGSACALIPVPGPFTGSTAVLRRCGGQSDTGDNFADFVTTARPPRNSSFAGAVAAPAVDGMTQVAGRVERAAATGYAGESALFTSSPSTCSGSITAVSINLSAIGGSGSQVMVDDGTAGDSAAGDGVYSYRFAIPPSAPPGFHRLSIAASDSGGRTGQGAATLTVAPVPPANDLCAAAEVLPAGPLPLFVSAAGSLLSAGPITQIATSCTTNGGSAGSSRDVWYSFTPAVTSYYTVSTCNSVTAPRLFFSQDTVLSIYSACPEEAATDHQGLSLDCNDEGCTSFIGGSPSTIPLFPMDAGVTYLVRVARRGSNSSVVGGPFRLDITSEPFGACCAANGACAVGSASSCPASTSVYQGDATTCTVVSCPPPPPPENDECAAAAVLQLGVPAPGTSYGASGADITACDETSWDVWYTYTAAAAGAHRLTALRTAGSETPALAVFAGCPPATDAHLACVAATYAAGPATLDFTAAAGSQYYIRAATHFSQRSDYTVQIGSSGCRADFDGSGAANVADIFAFLSAWFAHLPAADLDGVGGVQVADIFAFLSTWFAGC